MGDPLGYRRRVREIAAEYGLDPDIMERQIDQESGFSPRAKSSQGAMGIAQFMPATGKDYGLRKESDFYDPEKSLRAHGKYMSHLLKQYGGYPGALAHYNGGGKAGRAARDGRLGDLRDETREYLEIVLPKPPTPEATGIPMMSAAGGLNILGPLLFGVEQEAGMGSVISDYMSGKRKPQ